MAALDNPKDAANLLLDYKISVINNEITGLKSELEGNQTTISQKKQGAAVYLGEHFFIE